MLEHVLDLSSNSSETTSAVSCMQFSWKANVVILSLEISDGYFKRQILHNESMGGIQRCVKNVRLYACMCASATEYFVVL